MSARKLAPATSLDVDYLRKCKRHLREARAFAVYAGCPRLAAKIRRALKSADGARRHMERRIAAKEKEK